MNWTLPLELMNRQRYLYASCTLFLVTMQINPRGCINNVNVNKLKTPPELGSGGVGLKRENGLFDFVLLSEFGERYEFILSGDFH